MTPFEFRHEPNYLKKLVFRLSVVRVIETLALCIHLRQYQTTMDCGQTDGRTTVDGVTVPVCAIITTLITKRVFMHLSMAETWSICRVNMRSMAMAIMMTKITRLHV